MGDDEGQELPWVFMKVHVVRVVDGDTVDFNVNVGFRHTTDQRFRLLGLNAPEVRGEERPYGEVATRWVEEWLAENGPLMLDSYKSDSFGRWLARVYGRAGKCLNDDMVAAGIAVAWNGRGTMPRPWSEVGYPLPKGFDECGR